ncbi:MAG: shikimate dehydrogenase [Pseudomonadota bacterium]|jgi:shikimate dehydrogenase
MTDRYAVMGNPVAHSKSPRIHAAFAKQTAQQLDYSALLVEPGTFPARVRQFFAEGGKGLNITVPFKQEAWELVDIRSPQAELAGAVNTLLRDKGSLHGHNTDGIGLVRDILQNHQGKLADKSILVLGAGGATRGILLPLLEQKPARICIANRTVSKAEELADIFSSYGTVSACGFDVLRGQTFDWVLNATAASLHGELPPLPAELVHAQSWCYDLMYGSEPTIFCRWAQQQGAHKSLDGLGMLIEQAAEAFWLWRGLRPDTAPVLQQLRAG